MRTSWLVALVGSFLSILALAPSAKADSYQLYESIIVGYGQGGGHYFTGNEDLVVARVVDCGSVGINVNCWTTIDPAAGTMTTSQTQPSDPSRDDGDHPCSLFTAPTGMYVLGSVCNNGHEAIYGTFNNDSQHPVIYLGPDSPQFTVNEVGALAMDSMGDFAFFEAGRGYTGGELNPDTVELYLDETSRATPEPSSLGLLGTSLLSFVGFEWRKRLIRSRP